MRSAAGRVVGLISFLLVGSAEARAETPRPRASWKEKDAKIVAFAPDGKTLVSSGDGGFQLRDAATGRVRYVLSDKWYGISGLTYAPDSRRIYARTHSDAHKPVAVEDLSIWDVASGKVVRTFPYVTEGLNAVTEFYALSPDGRLLAVCDNGRRLPMQVEKGKAAINGLHEIEFAVNVNQGLPRVLLWDLQHDRAVATLEAGGPQAFSPDGAKLLTGAADWHDPTAFLWHCETGKLLEKFDSGGPWMKPVAFSPNGKHLLFGSNGALTILELGSDRALTRYLKPIGLDPFHFSGDGRILFPSALPRVRSWFQASEPYEAMRIDRWPPKSLTIPAGNKTVSPDGRLLARVQGDPQTSALQSVSIHTLPTFQEVGSVASLQVESAEFSARGRWLALMVRRNVTTEKPVHETKSYLDTLLVDPNGGRIVATLPTPGETWGNYGYTFAPDEMTLAVIYRTGSNTSRPGDPDPSDRPMNVELWELPAR